MKARSKGTGLRAKTAAFVQLVDSLPDNPDEITRSHCLSLFKSLLRDCAIANDRRCSIRCVENMGKLIGAYAMAENGGDGGPTTINVYTRIPAAPASKLPPRRVDALDVCDLEDIEVTGGGGGFPRLSSNGNGNGHDHA